MCGGGSRPAPPPQPAPAPPKAVDTKKAVDDLTESEKMRKGTKSTVLTGGDGVEMENIKKKKLLGNASETLGNY
tara:strand:+ start:561 stop:782 length:222 start_codon:yes stop_codon:yes gene_type:complete